MRPPQAPILLAWLMTLALSDFGPGFAIPAGPLVGFLVLAVIVGAVFLESPERRRPVPCR